MPAVISLTESDVMKTLGDFITGLQIAGAKVIQGLDNGVPVPKVPFISLTGITQQQLSTTVVTYTDGGHADDGVQDLKQPTRYSVQVDCYGPSASAWAITIRTALRSAYGCSQFKALNPAIAPLLATEARQLPIVNSEAQYEKRWTFEAVLQINPVVTLPQQFAGALGIELVSVDVEYPAGA